MDEPKVSFRDRRAALGEVIGGGYFVARRKSNGRLVVSPMPFEHPSHDAAFDEANRLATESPGRTFVVLEMRDMIRALAD